MKKLFQNKRIIIFYIIIILFLLIDIIKGKNGLIDQRSYKKDLNKLEKKLILLEAENRTLKKEIYNLRNNPEIIERLARKYGMLKKGEEEIIIKEKKK